MMHSFVIGIMEAKIKKVSLCKLVEHLKLHIVIYNLTLIESVTLLQP